MVATSEPVAGKFEVYLVPLDPAHGAEMQKTRPCVVVTPRTVNRAVRTVLVAPITSSMRRYPFRVNCRFEGRDGQVALEQIRCVDRSRLLKYLGRLPKPTEEALAQALVGLFAS